MKTEMDEKMMTEFVELATKVHSYQKEKKQRAKENL